MNYVLCQIKCSFLLPKYASKYNSLWQKSSQVPTPNPYRCETGGFDHYSTWVQDIHAHHGCTNCYAKNGSPRWYVCSYFFLCEDGMSIVHAMFVHSMSSSCGIIHSMPRWWCVHSSFYIKIQDHGMYVVHSISGAAIVHSMSI